MNQSTIRTQENLLRQGLDILEKIKYQVFLIEEDKIYLKHYDKSPWYERELLDAARMRTIQMQKKQAKVEDLEKEYRHLIGDIVFGEDKPTNVSIAENYSANLKII